MNPKAKLRSFCFEKDSVKSDEFRNEGNSFYRAGRFFEALESYNMSLLFAEPESLEKSLAYGNRSAVYLEVKEYDLCLENIKLARDSGYPTDKMQMLNEREEKCKKLIESDETTEVEDRWNFIKLSHPANEKIPFIVNCLQLRNNEKFGRHIITTEDLMPGDIIAIEEPVMKTVSAESRHLRCLNCLKSNKMSLIPHDKSCQMMFCSEDCKDKAEKGFVQAELATILSDFNHRMLNEALNIVGGNYDSLEPLVNDRELDTKTIFDFDLSDVNDSQHDYYKLLAFNGLFKGPFVQQMQYIQYHPCLKLLKNDREREIAKAFMLRTFKILTRNQFGYEWFDIPKRSDIGSAILLFGGLLNYSCISNVEWFYVDNKFVFVARRAIQKGQQLFRTEKINFTNAPREARQQYYRDRHGFTCTCEPCLRKLPPPSLFYQLPSLSEIIKSETDENWKKEFQENCKKIAKNAQKIHTLGTLKLMDRNLLLLLAIGKAEPFIF